MADSNLVARLRAVTANSLICREAADALAEQAETIERLTLERDRWEKIAWGYCNERDQLRAALREIFAKAEGYALSVAREALRDDPAAPVSR